MEPEEAREAASLRELQVAVLGHHSQLAFARRLDGARFHGSQAGKKEVIRYATGDIFESKAEVLVNPVNCEGVMGKGLALEFKKRFHGLFDWYRKNCIGVSPVTRIGSVLLYSMPDWSHKVICFPTKGKWRESSQYSHVERGLRDLRRKLLADWSKIASLAMPKLGCGLGGLKWELVCPMIETELRDVPQSIEVYA